MKGFAARRHLMAMTTGMALFAFLTGTAAAQDAEVIYGNDDRRDIFDQGNSADMVELARSTAALVRAGSLTPDTSKPGFQRLPSGTFASSFNLCPTERFRDQPNPAFCSGFLVAENILVTAGHCVETQTDCSSTAFVFGFSYESEGQDVTSVPNDNVYRCKRLIAQELNSSTQTDYAVIELDRNVIDRTPLKYRSEGKVDTGNDLTVIGHPSGLPTKIAGGASVRSNDRGAYFVANLDTYGGNSGSAVFNSATGEVEGILVRGETDFITRGGCRVSNECTDSGCRGEDVTRATEFAPHVPDPDQPSRPTTNNSVEAGDLGLAIPDNDSNGVTYELPMVSGTLAAVGLHVTIEHTYIGDLKIVLIHPDGTEAVVVDGSGGGTDNIDATFGLDGQSVADFAKFKNKDSFGTWKVRVTDKASQDEGTLQFLKLTAQVYVEE